MKNFALGATRSTARLSLSPQPAVGAAKHGRTNATAQAASFTEGN